MDPWIIAVISFLGGGSGLGGIYALIRHRMNLRFCRDMAEKHGIEGLEAAGRIVHPWAEATKDAKVRRQRRKAESAKQQPAVEVPRQAIAPSDDTETSVRTGRAAG